MLRFFADPVGRLFELHARFGAIVALADRDAALVCAFGAEANRVVLADPDRFHHHDELPFAVPADSVPRRLHTSLTSMNGALHKARRRALQPLFARAAVEAYRDAMADEIAAHLPRLARGATTDVITEMNALALRIAMRCLFGVPPTAALARLGVAYLERLIDPWVIAIPFAFRGTPRGRLFADAAHLEAGIRTLIDERRRAPGGDDLLARMLALPELADDELVGQVTLMFVAGYETTASTLAWTLLLLSQHERELALLAAELAPLGGRVPTVAELATLPHLDAVVRESMRLVPAAPFLFLRRTTAPATLLGHEVPEGALVMLSPLVTHRDPLRFSEPARFVPDRWTGLDPSPYEYLPFGAGPRLCLGAAFARQALRLALAAILSHAHPMLADGATVRHRCRGVILGFEGTLPMRWVAPGEARAVRPARGNVHVLFD